jgi:hypothetical protein
VSDKVARVEGLADALRRGDREAFRERAAAIMHDDADWKPLITAVEGREYRGSDGMARFFDDFLGTIELVALEAEFRQAGDDVVLMLATMRVRGRESQIEVPRELAIIFEFEAGRVRHARAYESHREAEELVA